MFDPIRFAGDLIARNPNIANNPQARELASVLQAGDARKGRQIAENLCNTYGVSKEEAIQQAKRFFNLPF